MTVAKYVGWAEVVRRWGRGKGLGGGRDGFGVGGFELVQEAHVDERSWYLSNGGERNRRDIRGRDGCIYMSSKCELCA